MLEGNLDDEKYPYEGERAPRREGNKRLGRGGDTLLLNNNRKAAKAQRKKENNESATNPKMFLFVVGGLSHHELVSISNLKKESSSQIIPGSNQIISPKQFIEQMENMHKQETIEEFENQIVNMHHLKNRGISVDDESLLGDKDFDFTIN